MPHKDSVAVFRTWYAPIIELARFLAGVRARPGIRRTESRRRTIRSHGNGSRLPRRCVVFIAKPTRRELAPLEAVAFLEVASLLLTVVRQRSFFPRNGDGVNECLRQRLAEAPAALMRPFLIVTSDPFVEIVLQFLDRGVKLLAESDAVEFI